MAKVIRPSSGVLEAGIKEVGNVVTNFGDNKTKRHVSDNETDLGHHELDNDTIGLYVDGIIKGIGCLLNAVDSGLKVRADKLKYEMDRATHHEEQENKRLEIMNQLEIAKLDFEQAANDRTDKLEFYRNECDKIHEIWHEMFEYFKANPDDPDRSEFLKQMGDIRRQATELSTLLMSGESKK